MLVLTRRIGERIRIETPSGEIIWITVVEMRGNRATLGVEAAKEVVIARDDWDGPKVAARMPS